MGIDLSDASYRFNLIAQSFNIEKHQGDHFYLAISRDMNGSITGCTHTQKRDERASLQEINEFSSICFQQYETKNTEAKKDIRAIKTGLEVIRNQVNNKDRDNCIISLWFWLRLGNRILSATQEIINKMSKVTESLILNQPTQLNQEIEIADQALTKARQYEAVGQYPQALSYYKIASKNGNLEATNVIIECYETGRLGQKSNPKDASQYHLKAAGKYLEINNQDAFSNACHKAFELAPEQTLLHVIRHWHLDILTLFEKAEIQKTDCTHKIVDAYALNVKACLDKGSTEQAMEQHKYMRPFDDLKASRILIEIAKSTLK